MFVSRRLNILSVLAIVYYITTSFIGVVHAQDACTLNRGFVGEDLGSVVFVAHEYDLHVAVGTPRQVVVTKVLPAVENAIVNDIVPFLIAACAPPDTNTSAYVDIVGIETVPRDTITKEECQSPSTSGQDCYRIHSELSVYVKRTGRDVETLVWLGVLRFHALQDSDSYAAIHPAIQNIDVDSTSWVAPLNPDAEDQKPVPRINILEALNRRGQRGGILGFFDSIYNNKVLFWWLVGGIGFAVLVLFSYLIYVWWQARKEGKTFTEGCKANCAGCKAKCASCKADCCGPNCCEKFNQRFKDCCQSIFFCCKKK